MKPQSGGRPFPEVAALAAHVASLEGLSTILDVGRSWTPEMALLHPELKVVGVGGWGAAGRRRPARFPLHAVVDLEERSRLRLPARLDPSRSAVVLTGPSDSLPDLEGGLTALDSVVRETPVTIIATTAPQPVLAHLAAADLQPSFVGRTRADEQDAERTASLFVLDRSLEDRGAAPSDFRVVAIMTAYNEEEIIGPSIAKLVADGVDVYVIDNWSSDGTHAIAEQFGGRDLVGLERFPDAPTDRYEWLPLLRRVEAVAAGLRADWCIHHDVDERRSGPWSSVGLRDALWRVDQSGFSAVDHTVLNFRPIDNGFTPGGDFEAYFRHFEFGRTSDLLLQVKAWKNTGPVDLAGSGGHEARFPGRRIFPYKFELKHYPVRSQAHGEQKVLRDRIARWDPGERALGWHVHYDGIVPGQSFLRDSRDLIEDRGPETRARYLAEILAGAGLADLSFPAWALGSSTGRTVYLSLSRLKGSRTYVRLRRFVLLPLRISRRMLRRLRQGPAALGHDAGR
ncbi:MAG: glycosyltransferase family 2 protein [Candidatus Limnocylindrales bacterium]|jgi:hypothetical protein